MNHRRGLDTAPDDGDAVRLQFAAALTPDAVSARLEQVRIQVLGNSMSDLSD
jgi:hypothetical protein